MDPNLFHLDWERTFEALAMIIVLSFFVERALAQIFETELFVVHLDRPGVKELIALGLSVAVCAVWKFDAISICILTEETTVAGYIITGGVVAGGSKASIKLFRDVLNVKNTVYDQRYALRAADGETRAGEAAAEAQDVTSPAKLQELFKEAQRGASKAREAAIKSGTKAVEAIAERAEVARDVVAAQAGVLHR